MFYDDNYAYFLLMSHYCCHVYILCPFLLCFLKLLWYIHVNVSIYRIIPDRGALRQGNGLEIHNLETELILPVFKAKLYHY